MPDPAQWPRIEALYYDALELPEAGRAAFLARVCAREPEVRREVESLLAARNKAGGFLSRPALELALLSGAQHAALHARLGSSIGHYQLLSVLGVGGMGEVFLAEDTRLHRQVALKLLPPQFSQQPGRVRRFEQEARATTALNHPNIVTLYDTGQHEGSYFIVNEFVDGQTLRAHLNEHGPLPVSEALNIAQQIATALAAAHAAGIVHRDIKPENVMLRHDGFVKVLDFGLAKLTGALPEPQVEQVDTRDEDTPQSAIHHPQSQTAAGALLGTIRYMSPEQARGGSVDARTDVFSLGVVLYEMLTGRTPFYRETANEALAAILEAEPLTLPKTVPAPVQCLLMDTLRKDREKRLQTVEELAATLRRLAEETQFNARLTGTSDWGGWWRWSIWAGVMLATGLAVYFLWKQQGNFESEVLPRLKLRFIADWRQEPNPNFTEFLVSLSPDEKWLAFSKVQDGQEDIFIKADPGGPVRLTNDTWQDFNPVWSPDGKLITYLSKRSDGYELWQIPRAGGASVRLTRFSNELVKNAVRLLRWSQDGQKVFFLTQCNVHSLNLATGEIKKLTKFSSSNCQIGSVALSANEQWLTYDENITGTTQIKVMSLNRMTPIQVTYEGQANSLPAWYQDGQHIVYRCSRNGVAQICVVDLQKGKSLQLTTGHQNLRPLFVAPIGNQIFYSSGTNEADLFNFNFRKAKETRLTDSPYLELSPASMFDGRKLAYQQVNDQANLLQSTIWIKTNDSYIRVASDAVDPRWAPQSPQLAFLRKEQNGLGLWVVEHDGKTRRLVSDEVEISGLSLLPFHWRDAFNYCWSYNGKQLAYLSRRSGQLNVWVSSREGGDARMVSVNHDPTVLPLCPVFSPTDHRIAYLSTKSLFGKSPCQLIVNNLAGEETIIYRATVNARLLGWSPEGTELIVAIIEDQISEKQFGRVRVLRIAIDSGIANESLQLSNVYVNSLCLSPDNTQIAYVMRDEVHDQLRSTSLKDGRTIRMTVSDNSLVYLASLAWSPDMQSIYYSKQSNSISLWTIDNYVWTIENAKWTIENDK